METTPYAHGYADIILNSDYSLYREVMDTVAAVQFDTLVTSFERENEARSQQNKQPMKGKQATINTLLRNRFSARGWETGVDNSSVITEGALLRDTCRWYNARHNVEGRTFAVSVSCPALFFVGIHAGGGRRLRPYLETEGPLQ